jgi:hypothetical protein
VTVLAGAFWVICLVLIAAGATKLLDPAALARVLGQLHVPLAAKERSARTIARIIGWVELLLGFAGLVAGGAALAVAIAAAYFGFSVLLIAARRASLTSCGCFGSRSGPPTRLHVALNLGSACVAATAAAFSVPGVADGLSGTLIANAALLVCVLLGTIGILLLETEHG